MKSYEALACGGSVIVALSIFTSWVGLWMYLLAVEAVFWSLVVLLVPMWMAVSISMYCDNKKSASDSDGD